MTTAGKTVAKSVPLGYLPDGVFPFNVPVLFPNGIPAIVFAAIVGILLNVVFVVFKPQE